MLITEILPGRRGLFLFNWILFLVVFVSTCMVQASFSWWQDLNWHSWLTEMSAIFTLGQLPVGSLWILWFFLSCFFSVLHLLDLLLKMKAEAERRAAEREEQLIAEARARSREESLELTLSGVGELDEKIIRLQEKLSRI
ncbi:MAG: hypothetical protein RI984_1683 [Pseudomonadota bacterium]|jgi:TRAP-type C4-dicarboxylate transport system permease small subunit